MQDQYGHEFCEGELEGSIATMNDAQYEEWKQAVLDQAGEDTVLGAFGSVLKATEELTELVNERNAKHLWDANHGL